MVNLLRKYIHPLSGKMIFWNFLLLAFVKLVFPQSAFQLASFVNSVPTFDSREVIQSTNEVRLENHLLPLKPNIKLDLAAEEKLNDMALKEYFAHVSPSGVTPWSWIQVAEYKYRIAGENLALGFTTSKDTVNAWLNSPSHRANILNSQYQDIGVAVKGVKIGETTGILVVQMFGLPVGSALSATNSITSSATLKTFPSVSTFVAGSQTKAESITPQQISTDVKISTVKEPIQIEFSSGENAEKATGILNNVFIIYALISSLLSMFIFFIYDRSRHMALKTALHLAILIITIVFPVSSITLKALIF